MADAHNVDTVLTQVINEQLTGTAEPSPVVTPDPKPVEPAPVETPAEQVEENVSRDNPEPEKPVESEVKAETTGDKASPIDEYGNPVSAAKTYTEDEVQRMIRDRLSRGRHAEQPTPQQVKQASDDFKADPNSEEPWEQQLETFIERTIDKRQKTQAEQQWKQQESARQAEFESKFSTGMAKYQDFHQVVAGKPITNEMLLATRSLENPAAFVYGASKMHPQELDRIARIADPYVQAAEVGRLHERMVKERKMVSNAPKPVEAPRGDVSQKHINQPSIEDRIHQYGKQRRK